MLQNKGANMFQIRLLDSTSGFKYWASPVLNCSYSSVLLLPFVGFTGLETEKSINATCKQVSSWCCRPNVHIRGTTLDHFGSEAQPFYNDSNQQELMF